MVPPSFLMVTCQVGAEAALKGEVARRHPEFRFAYSRPGFVTFKLPAEASLGEDFDLGAVFARAHSFSLGKAIGDNDDAMAVQAWKLAEGRTYDCLHVWQRDWAAPGEHHFEPGITVEAQAAEKALLRHLPPGVLNVGERVRHVAKPGELVLDIVLVGPREWWVGWHRARSRASRLPGGMRKIELPEDAVSRAYLKMEEALRWARLPLETDDRCVEIGCAPGGSCQALLKRGMQVIGIDPAGMPPEVTKHPKFTHIRKRASDVRRSEFHDTRWLFSDMNVAPSYTLDAVEGIVTYRGMNVRGMLLTLKLLEWTLADEVPAYLERIKAWGFPYVRARQLQHNRQEICVVALHSRPHQRRHRHAV